MYLQMNKRELEPSKIKIFKVSELTSQIKRNIEKGFAEFWVEGEISNLRIPFSGHIYLTLKDEYSQIKAVIFRSYGKGMKFMPKDGQHVLCRGHLTVYEPKGEYQIIVEYIEPKGIGALQLAFEQLKEKLNKEGLFDNAHKKALPLLPKKIGVVTSPTGAAIRDILQVLGRRFPNIQVLINPVPVQGEIAGLEIARAISELNEMNDIDILIVGRGGGSLEDLYSFNKEVVARAIYNSKIPVISAVGHEIDFTISDFVADVRAPTPSAAAEISVKSKTEFTEHINSMEIRLTNSIARIIEFYTNRLNEYIKHISDPGKRIETYLLKIDELNVRLKTSMINVINRGKESFINIENSLYYRNPHERIRRWLLDISRYQDRLKQQISFCIERKRSRLITLMGKINTLNPLSTLSRGYSIARRIPAMSVIKDAAQVKRGDKINIRLSRGELFCNIEEKAETE
ncbi:MAG: exodeoxyribonuclease VII large subunit [Nitrospirota bacterium]